MKRNAEHPADWRPAHFKDLVFLQRGFDITKAEQRQGNIPVVSSSGIQSYHSEAKVEGPGVVIGRKGSLGTVHFIDCPYWPHDTTLWSKDFRGNDPRYVYYFIQTMGLERYDVGNSNPTINRNHIHGLDILIPPLRTQKNIVEILSAYDDLIENNRRRIQLLEQSARLLYKEWFVHLRFPGHEHTKIIDGVPEGWERRNLEEIATIFKGKNITKETIEEGDVPVVAGGLQPAYYHNEANTSGPVVTISASGANAGYVALYYKNIWASDCSYLSITDNPEIWFLYLLMKSRQAEITGMQQGVAQPHVYPKHLKRLGLLNPARTLRKLFHETVEASFLQIANLEKQIEDLAKARDLLLPKLMNGEIAV